MNHYVILAQLNKEKIKNYDVGLVGARLGGEFNCTDELHIMTYEQVIN